jgi:hypothetical protein
MPPSKAWKWEDLRSFGKDSAALPNPPAKEHSSLPNEKLANDALNVDSSINVQE